MKTTLLFVFMIIQISYAQLQNVYIDSVYPHQNSSYFLPNGTVKVFFSQPMNASTITSDHIFVSGSLTGKHNADVLYQSATNSLELQPTTILKYGELISVTLDSLIQTDTGNNITPLVFTFNVKPESGSLKFAVADSFQLNFPPANIVSGDFNNDGNTDVIVSNYDSLKYTVLLNNGAGGFTLGEEMTGEFKPYSIAFTDIDNDRDLDMIISTNEENKIRILRGTGQGIFGWILPTIDVNAPIATCPGDFDGDGDQDFVALLNYALFDGRAYFFRNDGNGNFVESGFASIGFPATIRNVTGDIDNDGDLDIIAGQSDYFGLFKILRNDGYGVFTSEPGMNLGAHPDEFAGGDFDGDYDLDIFHCSWYANGLGFVINDGQGGFNDYLNLGNVGGQSRNAVANDFDGDGDLDFVAVFSSNNVGIVKNNGSPNFELYLTYPLPGLKGITAADFDNNGSVDIVGVSSTTNQIKFLKNCVDSLVAYFPLNGNANDESENFNNGICYNVTGSADRYGLIDKALYFDSLTSYIEGINPGNNLPEKNSPRSFSAWIKAYSHDDFGNDIFNYGTASMSSTNFRFFVRAQITIGNGDNSSGVSGNSNIIDSTWHFVTGVYEGGTEHIASLYVDGRFENSGAITVEPNTLLESRWMIGRFMLGDVRFNGVIDELKVFNFALTNQQIWDMYKTTTTAPTLLHPENKSVVQNSTTPLMDWDSTITAANYRLVIAPDSAFNTILFDSVLSTSYYQVEDPDLLRYDDNFYWKVRTINKGGIGPWSEVFHFNILFTDVEDEQHLPIEFALMQNYPNPFNPSTKISWQSPVSGWQTLKVYDVLGNEVATLVDEERPAGSYEVEFQSAVGNRQSASGVYYYQLRIGDFIQTKKMILIK